MTEQPDRGERKRRRFNLLTSAESPVSMWMRRDAKGKLIGWSNLRVLLTWCAALFGASVLIRYEWTMPAVYAFLGVPFMLVLDQVASQIPFAEIMAAIHAGASWLASQGASKVRDALASAGVGGSVTTEEEASNTRKTTTTLPPVVVAPTQVPPPAEEV